jgi:hypothetical protein
MIYPAANLELWARFGLALGFASSGHLVLACVWCADSRAVEFGSSTAARTALSEMLAHIEACPKRTADVDPLAPQPMGDGPTSVEIREGGSFAPRYGELVESTETSAAETGALS